MTILSLVDTISRPSTSPTARNEPWQRIYQDLLTQPRESMLLARELLETCLRDAAALPCDLPDSPSQLHAWTFRSVQSVTKDYAAYLARRRAGGDRQYFTQRAHALCFLRSVAPTKLVDGAWLYGLLPHWRDVRLQPLVRTYLEELGDGVPGQNHALMYRRLLAAEGCDELSNLDDALYLQGAIQLALGHMADDYLPEVIGYNLGYEQLPLHLLISAFELEELDIDPYYFLLHVTIDNSATGHAAKAVRAVLDNLPRIGDAKNFYRRVALGYRLNDLGESSHTIINGFDLEQELFSMFEHKRALAGQVHSDYCRIEGRTVNQWLSAEEGIGSFLAALQSRGWIKRHQDPINSRFWSLVQGEGAQMFGVFNAYEQQLIHDWIAGDWLRTPAAAQPSTRSFQKNRQRSGVAPAPQNELHSEQQLLHEQLQRLNPAQQEARLIELLAPVYHPTSAGLTATRIFSALTY